MPVLVVPVQLPVVPVAPVAYARVLRPVVRAALVRVLPVLFLRRTPRDARVKESFLALSDVCTLPSPKFTSGYVFLEHLDAYVLVFEQGVALVLVRGEADR